MISTTMKRMATGTAAAATVALTNFQFASAVCDNSTDVTTGGVTGGAQCAAPSTVSSNFSLAGLFGQIANILIFLVGAISVIVLIIGGLRYVISAGNPAQVTGAKNTILYAIVGIVIAIAAYAIVQFVFKQLGVQ
jgi:hypothetical protein